MKLKATTQQLNAPASPFIITAAVPPLKPFIDEAVTFTSVSYRVITLISSSAPDSVPSGQITTPCPSPLMQFDNDKRLFNAGDQELKVAVETGHSGRFAAAVIQSHPAVPSPYTPSLRLPLMTEEGSPPGRQEHHLCG